MVKDGNVNRYSVPLTPGWVDADAGDPASMEIEAWPLVQSYGLTDFQSGGYFTMNNTIVDASPALRQLFGHVDVHTLEHLVLHAVPSLRHHWWTFMQMLDARSPARRVKLTEAIVGDPLTSLYDFGRIRFTDDAPPGRGACVRFGTRTGSAPTDEFDDASVAESGVDGAPALHMTIVAEEPATGCRVARSYFLRTGLPPLFPGLRPTAASGFLFSFDEEDYAEAGMEPGPMSPVKEGPPPPDPPGQKDYMLLLRVYNALVAALHAATERVGACSTRDDLASCRAAAMDVLKQRGVPELLQPAGADGADQDVEVVVEVSDSMGMALPDDAPQSLLRPRCMVYIRVSAHHIMSVEAPGTSLGSLVAGDTVVPTGVHGHVLCLTRTIPYLRCWVRGCVAPCLVAAAAVCQLTSSAYGPRVHRLETRRVRKLWQTSTGRCPSARTGNRKGPWRWASLPAAPSETLCCWCVRGVPTAATPGLHPLCVCVSMCVCVCVRARPSADPRHARRRVPHRLRHHVQHRVGVSTRRPWPAAAVHDSHVLPRVAGRPSGRHGGVCPCPAGVGPVGTPGAVVGQVPRRRRRVQRRRAVHGPHGPRRRGHVHDACFAVQADVPIVPRFACRSFTAGRQSAQGAVAVAVAVAGGCVVVVAAVCFAPRFMTGVFCVTVFN